jgi:hypothetical protein
MIVFLSLVVLPVVCFLNLPDHGDGCCGACGRGLSRVLSPGARPDATSVEFPLHSSAVGLSCPRHISCPCWFSKNPAGAFAVCDLCDLCGGSVEVTVVNVLGSPGIPLWVNFTVDRTPPAASVVVLNDTGSGPLLPLGLRRVALAVSLTDALSCAGALATLHVRPPSGQEWSTVLQLTALGPFGGTTRSALYWLSCPEDGEYQVAVRAVDGAGNPNDGGTPASGAVVVVDTVAPVVTLADSVPQPWYVKDSTAFVEVVVVDAHASASVWQGLPLVLGAAGPGQSASGCCTNFSLAFAGVAAGGTFTGTATPVRFSGQLQLQVGPGDSGVTGVGVQGNVTLTVVGHDSATPPNHAVPLHLWLVRDSVAPVHTVALAPDGVGGAPGCVAGADTTACSSAAGVVFQVQCRSGQSPGPVAPDTGVSPLPVAEAPCRVQWALSVLQSGVSSCGVQVGGSGQASAGSTAPSGPDVGLGGVTWVDLPLHATMLDASVAAGTLVTGSSGDRGAVLLSLWTRSIDLAGELCMRGCVCVHFKKACDCMGLGTRWDWVRVGKSLSLVGGLVQGWLHCRNVRS